MFTKPKIEPLLVSLFLAAGVVGWVVIEASIWFISHLTIGWV